MKIYHVEGKLRGANFQLAQLKPIANSQVKKQIYNSFLRCHLEFGLLIWGSTYPTYLGQLETLQRMAVRNIASPYNQLRTDRLFNEFKLLKLNDIYKLQVGTFVHKFLLPGTLPSSFKDYFKMAIDVSGRESNRNNTRIYLPMHDSRKTNNLPNIAIAETWNSLTTEYREGLPKDFKKDFVTNIRY